MDIVNNTSINKEKRSGRVSHGMGALSDTVQKRQELMRFLSEKLSEESNLWARDVIRKMNKLFSSNNTDKYIKVKYFYDNALTFFTKYVEDVSVSEILCTVYLCALQIGVADFGDQIESNNQFLEEVDINDWRVVTIEDIRDFDIRTAMMIVGKEYGKEDCEIRACGLFTMQLIDYLNSI